MPMGKSAVNVLLCACVGQQRSSLINLMREDKGVSTASLKTDLFDAYVECFCATFVCLWGESKEIKAVFSCGA